MASTTLEEAALLAYAAHSVISAADRSLAYLVAADAYEEAGAAEPGPATHLRFLARCALWAAASSAAPGGWLGPGGSRRLVECGCGCGNSFVE